MTITARYFLCLLLVVCAFSALAQQDSGRTYIRLKVSPQPTREQQLQIDQFMRSREGVLMSRMDLRTNIYYAHVSADSGLSVPDFSQWLMGMGFSVQCSVSGIFDGNPPAEFPEDCGKETEEIEESTR